MPDALDGDFSRSRAVLIGTWRYHHLKPVAAAEHSLHRMRTLLMSPLCGGWPESQVSVVGNRDTLGNLPHELVTWFSSATDVALFYYVGHGQYDNDDRLCLSLTDSSPDAILRTTSSLTFDAVRLAFRASKATTKIAILDCCFAGLAGRDSALAGSQVLPGSSGFYLMMASGEFSTAWFQSATESSRPQTFFTKYLVDVIERGIPGQPRGLTLGPIFDQVADTLVRDGKPEPGCRVSDHAAHFVFARNTIAPPDHPTIPLPTLTGTTERVPVSDPNPPTVTINVSPGRWHIVTDIAFSPDGRLLAIASADMTVRLWDTATGQPVEQAMAGQNQVSWVAFHPDGRVLATADVDNTVRLWDTATGQPIGHPLTGSTVVFSPDGCVLATASADHTVQLWDPDTGWPEGDALTGHTDTVNWMVFSPDGRVLATASSDMTVRLWDPVKGQPMGRPVAGHTAGVNSVAFSPGGRLLATASADRTVRLWDVARRRQLGQPLTGHADSVDSVAFSPDGRVLASGSTDTTVRLWDPATGRAVGIPLSGHTEAVRSVAFSPDGSVLTTVGADHTVRLWDPVTGRPVGHPCAGHADWLTSVAFSPDGNLLATASHKTVRVWHRADATNLLVATQTAVSTDSIEFRLHPRQRLRCIMQGFLCAGFAGWFIAQIVPKFNWSFSAMFLLFFCGIGLLYSVNNLKFLIGRLTLTAQGVELKRWLTTMIPWKEIQSVQTGTDRVENFDMVEFVLSDRSELSWVPGHYLTTPDREFDQKLQTIQQWHARFGGRMPGK